MLDLVSARFGGAVVSCNDEFFAEASNLIKPEDAVWKPEAFTDRGKWMDGWETRRRREDGYDWCIVSLGLPGIIRRVTVDTSHFTGNFPESFSLEACGVRGERLDEAEWVEVISRTRLQGDSKATFDVSDPHRVTHVRLNIFPDGGVARLRVEGEPVAAKDQVCPDSGLADLVLATVGGRYLEASNTHYSTPEICLSPSEPLGMWDGWETARRRGPGNDWAAFELGLPGTVHCLDVDTRHFKGNPPGWVDLDVAVGDGEWVRTCERVAVDAHAVNRIDLAAPVAADRIRLNIYPDGGVARLRVWGRPDPVAAAALRMRYLDSLFPQPARSFFRTACAASTWVEAMVTGRPYETVEAVMAAAGTAFDRLSEADWLEAFAAHPRIGERRGNQNRAGETLSAAEQAKVATASRSEVDELGEVNRRYEERFGFTYIVRAAGRDAAEMLALAKDRLDNDYATEVTVAAAQQREITLGRLSTMLCQS